MITSYSNAVRDALREEMQRDDSVFVMGQDIAAMGGVVDSTQGLHKEFGEDRVRNVPISEAAFVGAMLGAALTGMRPLTDIAYADFLFCAMDQIANQIAKYCYMSGGRQSLPLVIRAKQGAGRGNAAQHAQSIESLFCQIPGLKIVMPSSGYDAKGLLKAAIREDNPVLFLEDIMLYQTEDKIPKEEYVIPLGKADVKKQGQDISIIATAWQVHNALESAKELQAVGIDAEVIDLRTIVPLDKETVIASVKKTKRALIVNESNEMCGIGAEIAYLINQTLFSILKAPATRIAVPQAPMPYSKVLEEHMLPTSSDITTKAKELVQFT